MEKDYGKVTFNGKEYTLTQDAYYEYDEFGGYYTANAKMTQPIIDDYGDEVKCSVKWDIKDDYDSAEQEEEDACDWDSPSGVHIDCYWLNGEFNHSEDI